ncbi:MAG: FxsA family protein [Pseudomonadota bacterium]
MWVFLTFIAIPLIEIALFIEIGGLIGVWPTIAIVILSAIAGVMLLRAQGVAAMTDIQTRLNQGRDPSSALAHGALRMIGALALMAPGFFTDAIGLLLLFPPIRSAVISFMGSRVQVRTAGGFDRGQGAGRRKGDKTIDGDYVDVTPPEEQATPGHSGWTKGTDQIKPPE